MGPFMASAGAHLSAGQGEGPVGKPRTVPQKKSTTGMDGTYLFGRFSSCS